MTALVWDKPSDRTYQSGVDRGVLYLSDGSGVAWNGLTSVEDDTSATLTSYWLDGVKYLDNLAPGDYAGKLKAFTYPDEFDLANGIVPAAPGLMYHDQPVQKFGLSYRTKVGSALAGTQLKYKIHLLYNLTANPDNYTSETFKNPTSPIEFSWTLSGTPESVVGYRPPVHVTIDSGHTDPEVLPLIENILYGTDTVNPRLPSLSELSGYFGLTSGLVIIDNGDGTWTAVDTFNNYVTMLDDTTFQIAGADVTYLDSTTYTISSTNVE
jgi:hypothetical protein